MRPHLITIGLAALFAEEIGGLLLALDIAHLRFRRDQALLKGS